MKKLLIALALLLSACSSTPEMKNNATVQVSLFLTTPEMVNVLCRNDDPLHIVLGCAYRYEDGKCLIIAREPPADSYLPYIMPNTPREYTVIGHEFLHCFGWEHERLN